MKRDIIIAGVGGQGILSIATVIGMAAMDIGLYLKQSEVHGMSQRGGDVQSHLRISDEPVYSDLIPTGCCDIIISVEPMESLRYIPWLSEEGWLVTNSIPFENIPDYPQVEDVIKEVQNIRNHLLVDADSIARDIQSPRSGNMVVLGAATPYLGIPYEKIEEAVRNQFRSKGEKVMEKNVIALERGRQLADM